MAYKLEIDQNRCKGCGLCVSVCPKNVLEISDKVNTNGYFPVRRVRPEKCNFCSMCCVMCPDVAITITEVVADKEEREDTFPIYETA